MSQTDISFWEAIGLRGAFHRLCLTIIYNFLKKRSFYTKCTSPLIMLIQGTGRINNILIVFCIITIRFCTKRHTNKQIA